MTLSARASLGVVAIALNSACSLVGPTASMTGVWQGMTQEKFPSYTFLNLQQEGDEITGTACYLIFGKPRYRAAQVIGLYPYVGYVITETTECDVPGCAGLVGYSWRGRLDRSGDIVSNGIPGRFMRIGVMPAACLRP
jgi:hypothetical protein